MSEIYCGGKVNDLAMGVPSVYMIVAAEKKLFTDPSCECQNAWKARLC
jgi:hypothetical protein